LFEEIIINGAIAGGTLALLAVGFTLVYGIAEVVNMAHGALFMLGAYVYYIFTAPPPYGTFQLDVIPAMIIAIVSAGIVGAIIYRLTIEPIIEDLVAVLVVTVGVAIIIQQIMLINYGAFFRGIPNYIEGYQTILGIKVTNSQIIAFAASMTLFALLAMFITKTKIGTSMRAIAQDREIAMLMGVNTERLCMFTMAISASIAALAGILISASTTGVAHPTMWTTPLYMSFAIVILGGLGSIKGVLIGAFIVGYAEIIFVYTVPGGSYLKGVVALAVMATALLLRPKGLFGKRIELED
jgi:branched-chain amino acid transport system permease protein